METRLTARITLTAPPTGADIPEQANDNADDGAGNADDGAENADPTASDHPTDCGSGLDVAGDHGAEIPEAVECPE